MTKKQENILKAALKLFAEEGYKATSTSRVAAEAGVSEGLIFRHFGNKEGLLQAVVSQGQERAQHLFNNIIHAPGPKAIIQKAASLPFDVPIKAYGFWRLQFKLKWELEQYDGHDMEPLIAALTKAFKSLKYKSPELEAQFLITCIEGMAGAILKGNISNKSDMLKMILSKYNLK